MTYSCFFDFAKNATPEERAALTRILRRAEGVMPSEVLEGVALLEVMARFWAGFKRLPSDVQKASIATAIERAERREAQEEL